MTVISQNSPQLATSTRLGGVVRRLGIWAHAAATRWERRAAAKTLSQMSDRELRDIGLERCDIEAAVRRDFHPDIGGL